MYTKPSRLTTFWLGKSIVRERMGTITTCCKNGIKGRKP